MQLRRLSWYRPDLCFAADGITEVLRETHWGESSDEVLHPFDTHAMRLTRALDFGLPENFVI